jgi:hypothetical protein
MSYVNLQGDNFLDDIIKFKEFAQLHIPTKQKSVEDECNDKTFDLPRCIVEKEIRRGNYMIPRSYQLFGQMFINPNTPFERLLLKHNTGSGKTVTALGIAKNFIKMFQQEAALGHNTIGSIFIMGFDQSQAAFKRELFRYAEFGFVTRDEVRTLTKLIRKSSSGSKYDRDNLSEFKYRIRGRLSNRKNNGFFKFMGYKAFANRLFITKENISGMSESDIRQMVKSGSVKINMSMVNTFKNSLMICDEVHNIYNSARKNNWGVAIQIVLDMVPTLRAVFLSATPINNSPTESVDLINLLVPYNMRLEKDKLFTPSGKLIPGALDIMTKLSIGRISYLQDVNPEFFPSKEFMGVSIPGIAYLKFVRCSMSKFHANTYAQEVQGKGTVAVDAQSILDIVFPNPNSTTVGIYKSHDLKQIASVSSKWKNDNHITLDGNGTATGEFLNIKNIGKYSTKYAEIMKDIIDTITNGGGKIFIYHSYVSMAGVLLISEMLNKNGIISTESAVGANTLCSVCGIQHSDHTAPKSGHMFNAARHLALHSGIDSRNISKYMERYNTVRNATGQDVMVLIGSRIMQESREVRNTENIMIAHKPDNISTLIQILGRVNRTNSHSDLPPERRHVKIRIYVSSIDDGKDLTYEEIKYKEKIEDYKTIQQIEKRFHEVATDGAINYPIIKNALTSDGLGDLVFKPAQQFKAVPLKDMKLSTFTVFHTQDELKLILYVIKRVFLEVSQVWTYDTLWDAVRNPTFRLPVNSHMFSQDNFTIALSQLTYNTKRDVIITDVKSNKRRFLDRLFDNFDKRIVLPGSLVGDIYHSYGGIVQIDKYYMLFPILNNTLQIGIDAPHRLYTESRPRYVNVRTYLERTTTGQNYFDRKLKFRTKYESTPLEKLGEAVCEYGVDFHKQFLEECITYIFSVWVIPSTHKSEYHEFYFKMIFYYDIIGLVVWGDTVSSALKHDYEKYLLPVTKPKKVINADNVGRVNTLKRELVNSKCSWCPDITTDLYTNSVSLSLSRFAKSITTGKKSDTKVDPKILPVGHLLHMVPRFYTPDKQWFDVPEYGHRKGWKENDIVVGYASRSNTGVHVRFKLRTPIHKMKDQKDVRKIEKGTMCTSINRTRLAAIAKAIGITIRKGGIPRVCADIKARLMYLDLEERANGTDIRWFYNFWETQPVKTI